MKTLNIFNLILYHSSDTHHNICLLQLAPDATIIELLDILSQSALYTLFSPKLHILYYVLVTDWLILHIISLWDVVQYLLYTMYNYEIIKMNLNSSSSASDLGLFDAMGRNGLFCFVFFHVVHGLPLKLFHYGSHCKTKWLGATIGFLRVWHNH